VYIINVQYFSPHEITAGGSLAGKYIINTRDFPRPTKVIVTEKLLNVAINTNKVTQMKNYIDWINVCYTVTDRNI
jgi:hypothetical protein